MTANTDGNPVMDNRKSYSSQEPELRKTMPVSLREMRALRSSFDNNRCPYVSRQLRDAGKTEAQRREESAKGSMMVKRHQPFPTLRPKRAQSPIRESFNRNWLREQRKGFLANRQAERLHQQQERHNVQQPSRTR